MREFKTYNDKDYENDDFARILEKIAIFVLCPPLLIILPYIIYDEFKNGNKSDGIILSIICCFCLLIIISIILKN